ncbi:hypothetical protein [Streptomyces sp. L2]|uniref:hypothetical protein n=1 Tax=Streptomyces sp. L2 TaxID=2162665 RepID=UPI0013E935C9|nr:hypothetical protein [Streptomyces sp. L2]
MSARHKKVRQNSIAVANRYVTVALAAAAVVGVGAAGAGPAMASSLSASDHHDDHHAVTIDTPRAQESYVTNNSARTIYVVPSDSKDAQKSIFWTSLAKAFAPAPEKVKKVQELGEITVSQGEEFFTHNGLVAIPPGKSARVYSAGYADTAGQINSGKSFVPRSVHLDIIGTDSNGQIQSSGFDSSGNDSWVVKNDSVALADPKNHEKEAPASGNGVPNTSYGFEAPKPTSNKDGLLSNIANQNSWVVNTTSRPIFVNTQESKSSELASWVGNVAKYVITEGGGKYGEVAGTFFTVTDLGAKAINAYLKETGVTLIAPGEKRLVSSLNVGDEISKPGNLLGRYGLVNNLHVDVMGTSPDGKLRSQSFDTNGNTSFRVSEEGIQDFKAPDTYGSATMKFGPIIGGAITIIDSSRGNEDKGDIRVWPDVVESRKATQAANEKTVVNAEVQAKALMTALGIREDEAYEILKKFAMPNSPTFASDFANAYTELKKKDKELDATSAADVLFDRPNLWRSDKGAKLNDPSAPPTTFAGLRGWSLVSDPKTGESWKVTNDGQGTPVQFYGHGKDGSWHQLMPDSSVKNYDDVVGYVEKDGAWQKVEDPRAFLRGDTNGDGKVDVKDELPGDKKRQDDAQKAKEEADAKAKEEADRKAKEEADAKAKEEADRKAKEEADRKAKEEADRKAKEEADRKAKEEADRKAKEEADRKAKEEADRKAKEEADRKAKEEADRKAKEEADRKAKEEADRKAKEEADRRAKEEADRRAKEEADRRAKEEADRRAKEEADRRAKEEADRRAKEEADRRAKEEADRRAKEEADRRAKEEADRKAKEEADRRAKEEADRRAKEEADRRAKEEADRRAKEEADRRAREEADRRAREEADRRAEEHRREDQRREERR